MPIPKRPGLLVVLLLLVLLAGVVAWLLSGVSSPPLDRPVQAEKSVQPTNRPAPPELLPPVDPSARPAVIVDTGLQTLADQLHSADSPPERDLEVISEFLQVYGKALGGNPIGDNADITAALTGSNGHKGRLYPPGHRTIQNGQLIDRWGTPYWFHPNSGKQMEIRSAGPDKQLFNLDDVVLNPSPPGLGVTQAEDLGSVK